MAAPKEKSKSSAVESLIHRQRRKTTVPNNPFNKVSSIPKRQIALGRKIKGADRNVTAARTKAIHSRLQSLHDEFNRKHNNKINRFIDNRFGQFNPSLTAEQKSQIRFEQERRKKNELYNLDDDNVDGANEITHFGAALSCVLQDEHDEEIQKNHELQLQIERDRELMAEEARCGVPRTRQEILQDIIIKSKQTKAEAALAKEQDAAILADLDSAWLDLRSAMIYSKDDQCSDPVNDDPDDDFEMISRQLSTQATEAASDRTLTEAEAAAKTHKKLVELEQERLKRMAVPMISKQTRHSIEDLTVCNVEIDPEFVLPDSDHDISDMDDDDYDLRLSGSESEVNDITISNKGDKGDVEELPYIIHVPDNVEDLIDLGKSDRERLSTVIERIRACSHISFHTDNSMALQRLFRMLLQYLRGLWSDSVSFTSNTIELSHVLTNAIAEMAIQFPRLASDSFLQNIISKIDACLPPLCDLPVHTLIELQVAMQIFSISDYIHACITPLLFAVTSYLSALQIRRRTMSCLARSILLCDILLQYVQQSHRFIPELINHMIICMQKVIRDRYDGNLQLTSLFSNDGRVPLNAFMSIFRRALSLHEHLSSYPELISPFCHLLEEVNDQVDLNQFMSTIQKIVSKRTPLVINRNPHKIRERDPVVYEDFIPGKAREQDAEKRHQKALLRKLKSEKKGARRELRRDAQFIENERRQLTQKKELQKTLKLKENRTFLENLGRDTNMLRLSKRKK